MGNVRVGAHRRRGPNGEIIEVSAHKRTGLDALKDRLSPVNKRRRSQKRQGLLSPGRGWDRIRRAWDHARKRRKTTAAVLALGGVGEIVGFLAARGIGSALFAVALGMTALAGGLLAASGGEAPKKKRNPPRGTPARGSGKRRPRKRRRRLFRRLFRKRRRSRARFAKNTTKRRTVYETAESQAAAAKAAEPSFEQKHAETVFEGDDGKSYDVHGNEKGAA